jgi:integrase
LVLARIGAALGMAVEDVYTQNRRLWVRLREKGGKRHATPCHHNLEEYLTAYLDGADLRGDPKGPLFRRQRIRGGRIRTSVRPQDLRQSELARCTSDILGGSGRDSHGFHQQDL